MHRKWLQLESTFEVVLCVNLQVWIYKRLHLNLMPVHHASAIWYGPYVSPLNSGPLQITDPQNKVFVQNCHQFGKHRPVLWLYLKKKKRYPNVSSKVVISWRGGSLTGVWGWLFSCCASAPRVFTSSCFAADAALWSGNVEVTNRIFCWFWCFIVVLLNSWK